MIFSTERVFFTQYFHHKVVAYVNRNEDVPGPTFIPQPYLLHTYYLSTDPRRKWLVVVYGRATSLTRPPHRGTSALFLYFDFASVVIVVI